MNKVLIVEDNVNLLNNLTEAMELEVENADIYSYNGDVSTANNAIEFLKKVGEDDHVVIILDHNLVGEFKGDQLIKMIVDQVPGIREKLFVIGTSDMSDIQGKYLRDFHIPFVLIDKTRLIFELAELVNKGLTTDLNTETSTEQRVV